MYLKSPPLLLRLDYLIIIGKSSINKSKPKPELKRESIAPQRVTKSAYVQRYLYLKVYQSLTNYIRSNSTTKRKTIPNRSSASSASNHQAKQQVVREWEYTRFNQNID